jgi:hypothetical protein
MYGLNHYATYEYVTNTLNTTKNTEETVKQIVETRTISRNQKIASLIMLGYLFGIYDNIRDELNTMNIQKTETEE